MANPTDVTERTRRRVTVVTVTYNCAPLARAALRSANEAAERADLDLDLQVVDNASTDNSVEVVRTEFPEAHLIVNRDNVGFGRANNQAFALATGDYWLLLNPDATVAPDTLSVLVRFLDDHPTAAAVGPSVMSSWRSGLESGGMSPSLRSLFGHFFLINRLLWADRGGAWRGIHLHRRSALGPRQVDWVSAAAVLLRPEAVRRVGGFDPRIFMYGEDVDLGDRLRADGWSLWIEPAATAAHLVGGTQDRASTTWVDAVHANYAARAARHRVLLFDVILVAGLFPRALLTRLVRGGEDGRIHSRTLLLSARRATELTRQTLVDGWGGSRRRGRAGQAQPGEGL